MISFACQRIKFEDLIRCSFNLNKTELKLLQILINLNREVKTSQLAESLDMDRSSIQKGISGLLNKGLAKRRQVNLEKGGYFFYYSTLKKSEIKESMNKIINAWYQEVSKEIEAW
jgi:predicted transcriptional regulator